MLQDAKESWNIELHHFSSIWEQKGLFLQRYQLFNMNKNLIGEQAKILEKYENGLLKSSHGNKAELQNGKLRYPYILLITYLLDLEQ